ncbi:serine/threonine-protein kinase [Streptomyces sp. NPDC045431]|uniref:serine/threonine-protein kinase n=1 Tax=Streptomyces sp. NPDC045431 TaxID=3155613 RepID=UPI0034078F09
MQPITAEDPAWIGPYRLLGRLGEGGMGRVYLARSEGGRTVAVKLILRQLSQDGEFRQRFAQEVDAARRVGGRWTAPVLDADTGAAMPWVATGYIPGPSLSEVVGKDHGPLPEESVRALASGLSQALGAIHSVGLVHRDLKPSNILVTVDGPRVIDFGIARALDAHSAAGDVRTRTGAVVGSPGFMAPEQVRGGAITPASDVFCLGAVLAYAATGRTPFGSLDSGVHSVMYRIVQEEPDLTGVPPRLAGLVRACLIKDPAGRPSVAELIEATRDAEPAGAWLPGALLAQLGQRAARLLDAEAPASAAATVVPGPAPAPALRQVPQQPTPPPHPGPYGPTAFPTPPPGPGPYPYPHQPTPPPATRPPMSGGRVTLIVLGIVFGLPLAVIVLLVIIGVLVGEEEEPEIKEPVGAVPGAYLGSWEGTMGSGTKSEFAGRLDIVQGQKNETVATVTYTLPHALCEDRVPLVSAGREKIVLGAGTRVRHVPEDTKDCDEPAAEQTLKAQPDGTLLWQVGGKSTTLRPAETGDTAVPARFLGTWDLTTTPADKRLRFTIEQGAVGTQAVTLDRLGSAEGCQWKGELSGAQGDRLVTGPLLPAKGGCREQGSMVLTPADDGKLYVSRPEAPGGVGREELKRVPTATGGPGVAR